jgi:hypothetical protein
MQRFEITNYTVHCRRSRVSGTPASCCAADRKTWMPACAGMTSPMLNLRIESDKVGRSAVGFSPLSVE